MVRAAAADAVRAAGVRVIAGEDQPLPTAALALLQQIRRADSADAPGTTAVLRAVTHAGGYCPIARDVRGSDGQNPRGTVGTDQTGVPRTVKARELSGMSG